MNDFSSLISALKILLSTGIDFGRALVGVGAELFQLVAELVKGGLSILP